LDPDIIVKENLAENRALIQHFALGINSTYVVTRKDGYRNFNLKGHYRNLGQRLRDLGQEAGVKVRRNRVFFMLVVHFTNTPYDRQ